MWDGHRLRELENLVNVKHMELGNPNQARLKFLLVRAAFVARPQGSRPVGNWMECTGETGYVPPRLGTCWGNISRT
jgi:hypothetical protein